MGKIQILLFPLNLLLRHCSVVLLHVFNIHGMFVLRLKTEHSPRRNRHSSYLVLHTPAITGRNKASTCKVKEAKPIASSLWAWSVSPAQLLLIGLGGEGQAKQNQVSLHVGLPGQLECSIPFPLLMGSVCWFPYGLIVGENTKTSECHLDRALECKCKQFVWGPAWLACCYYLLYLFWTLFASGRRRDWMLAPSLHYSGGEMKMYTVTWMIWKDLTDPVELNDFQVNKSGNCCSDSAVFSSVSIKY